MKFCKWWYIFGRRVINRDCRNRLNLLWLLSCHTINLLLISEMGGQMGEEVNHIWTKPRKSAKMNGSFAWVNAPGLFLGIDFTTHLLRIQWFQPQLQTGGQTHFSASFWFQCSTTANLKQTRNKNLTVGRKKNLFPSFFYSFGHSPVLNWHKENFKLIYLQVRQWVFPNFNTFISDAEVRLNWRGTYMWV